MKMYYLKLLSFTFLINVLILSYYENCQNKLYNINLIRNNTKRTTIKSRLLAQTKNHNPHYHNDPELKEIIDKLNDEAIKKYQKTHDPYEQLQELVEKRGTKTRGRHVSEPMSTLEKDLSDTYEEIFGNDSHMVKSGLYTNNDDRSDKSSICECIDTNNTKLATTKGKDKYLKHLKHRCTRGIYFCSVGSIFLTFIGLYAAKAAAVAVISPTVYEAAIQNCVSSSSFLYIFEGGSLTAALKAGGTTCATAVSADIVTPAVGAAIGCISPLWYCSFGSTYISCCTYNIIYMVI
ncbi:stevor isoform troph beta [Plasmodium falciparum Dd2]|uniref:Stevor isoform troph beta n=1 Tax=Plasmodium falciparum (isolate Dd2) TaxID=57267 RepID=A0A0L7M1A0_PLAF4|nr:stevor isoform troph beta [Plasmodium falciparum Dd2]